jgi:hypothetical protein
MVTDEMMRDAQKELEELRRQVGELAAQLAAQKPVRQILQAVAVAAIDLARSEMAANRKIYAIKALRQTFGLDLKEAKERVEQDHYNDLLPDQDTAQHVLLTRNQAVSLLESVDSCLDGLIGSSALTVLRGIANSVREQIAAARNDEVESQG